MILTGNKEYFKGIDAIEYEGKDSDNPLAFKYYDPRTFFIVKCIATYYSTRANDYIVTDHSI